MKLATFPPTITNQERIDRRTQSGYFNYLLENAEYQRIKVFYCRFCAFLSKNDHLQMMKLAKREGDNEYIHGVTDSTVHQLYFETLLKESFVRLKNFYLRSFPYLSDENHGQMMERATQNYHVGLAFGINQYYPLAAKSEQIENVARKFASRYPKATEYIVQSVEQYVYFMHPQRCFRLNDKIQEAFAAVKEATQNQGHPLFLRGAGLFNTILKKMKQSLLEVDSLEFVCLRPPLSEDFVRPERLAVKIQRKTIAHVSFCSKEEWEHSLDLTISGLYCDQDHSLHDLSGQGLTDLRLRILRMVAEPLLKLEENSQLIWKLLNLMMQGFHAEPILDEALHNWEPQLTSSELEENQCQLAVCLQEFDNRSLLQLLAKYGLVQKLFQPTLSSEIESFLSNGDADVLRFPAAAGPANR